MILPLFPLPNLVFFPQTRLPLHVFEPRYRQLITDALKGERRLGIILLRSGWEASYFGAPPLHEVGTIGTIEQAVPLDDGRFNILVRGEARFRIVDEVKSEPYRRVNAVEQPQMATDAQMAYAQRQWLADLSRQYLEFLPDQMEVPEIETVGLESLTNALIMSLNYDVTEKQRLLEIDDLLRRAEEVGNELATRIESMRFLKPYRRENDPSRN
jgi:Lon protease-like protein